MQEAGGVVTLPTFQRPGSHLILRTQMDVEGGPLTRVPGREKKKNLRKSEGLATPGKDLSIGGRVVREDTIPESAGKTEQWGRENERTLDPGMDPNRSPRVEMQS